jgi:hypothetical protein
LPENQRLTTPRSFGPNGNGQNDEEPIIPGDVNVIDNSPTSTSLWTKTVLGLSAAAAVAMLLLLSVLMFQRRKRVHHMEAAIPMPMYQPTPANPAQHTVSQWLKSRQYQPLHVAAMLNDLFQLDALLAGNPKASPSMSDTVVESRLDGQAHVLSPPPLSEGSLSSHSSLNDDSLAAQHYLMLQSSPIPLLRP